MLFLSQQALSRGGAWGEVQALPCKGWNLYSQGREGGSQGPRSPVLPSPFFSGLWGHGTLQDAENEVTIGIGA